MNKKEILEIKKQLTPDNCNLTRIVTCLVTSEKEIILQKPVAFLSLPEEESFKFFDLFRIALSGNIGKNLFPVSFPTADRGEAQLFLNGIRKSRLEDENLISALFEKIANSYQFPDDYLIALVHGCYDIPGKGTDGSEQFDASDEVYEYIQCILCPVALSKSGLAYNVETNSIMDRIRDKIVEKPFHAFLFPAFNDRGPDINEALYYCKKAADEQPDMVRELFGNERPASNEMKTVWLQKELTEMQQEGFEFPEMRKFYADYVDQVNESNGTKEGLTVDAGKMADMLEAAGATEERIEMIREQFQEVIGKETSVSGFMDTKKMTIKTPAFQIKADPEYVNNIKGMTINGRLSLVIEVDSNQVEVNGVPLRLSMENKNS